MMAVHLAVTECRKWIVPQVYLHEFSLDQYNQTYLQGLPHMMGAFDSKFMDANNNNVNRVLIQRMDQFPATSITNVDETSYDIFPKEKNRYDSGFFDNSLEDPRVFKETLVGQKMYSHNNNNHEQNEIFPFLPKISLSSNKRTRGATMTPTKELSKKRQKKPTFTVNGKEMQAFFGLLEDSLIHNFLSADGCKRYSDKYLLAMVFTYFKRAGFSIKEYSRMNFFLALYLANDMEEDEEDYKYEIFPWALGKKWKSKYIGFLSSRDALWKQMGYKSVVSRKCCEEIMGIEPGHWSWQRERPEHHAGALRPYNKEGESCDFYPRGPDMTPRKCNECASMVEYDSGHTSGSGISWYLSSSSDSSPDQVNPTKCMRLVPPRFYMEDLKMILNGSSGQARKVEE